MGFGLHVFGVEIGGTKLQLFSGHPDGTIRRRVRFAVDRGAGGPGICRQIEQGLDELRGDAGARPAALGVGFGGPVDWQRGVICTSHQIAGWENFPLNQWLSECLARRYEGGNRIPVVVENDANTGALGEALCGAGRGSSPVFYVTLGSGVGGGLAVDGRIYHGAPPGEAEFGHLRLDHAGTIVESRCSGWAIDRRIREYAEREPNSELCKLVKTNGGKGGEARLLTAALRGGDAGAAAILRELSADLALALSHVIHLIHPATIVLGGGLSLMGQPLLEPLVEKLPGYVMKGFWPVPAVKLAGLGEDAVPTGALLLAGRAAMERRA
jgi:glucokinase